MTKQYRSMDNGGKILIFFGNFCFLPTSDIFNDPEINS